MHYVPMHHCLAGSEVNRRHDRAIASPTMTACRQPRRIELAVGRQKAQRDRQVEAARLLGQVGRRQVDDDPLVVRKREAALLQRRAHPLARLLDLDVGQADEREARQPVGQVHLDRHGGGVQAIERAAVNDGKRHAGDGFTPTTAPAIPLWKGRRGMTHRFGA